MTTCREECLAFRQRVGRPAGEQCVAAACR